QSPAEAVAALDEARRRHIVWAKDQDSHCAFLHDKLRHTLLDRLPASERRELHRRAALHLEGPGARGEGRGAVEEKSSSSPLAPGPSPLAFDLAYHFDAAGESARALPYALASADQARARHSLEVA